MTRAVRWIAWAFAAATLACLTAALAFLWLGRDRGAVSDLPWPVANNEGRGNTAVTLTWLGITTLLFDDGETQILIDGTFTRLGAFDVVLQRKLRSDIATINYAMDEFRMDRLAAVVPLHTHIDHAIDAGNVTNRSTAVLLGSESAANIARGAGVPVDQYQILASGERRHFGDFVVTLIESRHVPNSLSEQGWLSGRIEQPLTQPARIAAWRGGRSTAVLIEHPAGNSLVQGSAGFIPGQFDELDVDVTLFSVAGLAALGETYTRDYWRETVAASGAERALAIHWDDFSQPFGEQKLLPNYADNVLQSAAWINAAAGEGGVVVERPAFGVPLNLY